MPFLRAVGPGATQLAIRSSKTLVGSSASKCDLVLPREHGVLELHALLNLGDDQATATLVPFSAASDGACFLNGRLVPPDGATVVHGDRVAFGSADNAFVLSLTDSNGSQPTRPVDTASLQNSRSFRRALDALRGDRVPATSAPSASMRKTESTNKSLSSSASRERLERFLMDASTDSLLGDFVERKLRSSNSVTASRRARAQQRPVAMEPPPSLSASSVSSLRSSLNDSILDRTANQRKENAASAVELDPLLSTAERNYAEIEKLRLSQRLREVNNVLNGHLNFSSSYLSTERRSSGSASMRYSSPVKPERKPSTHEEVGDGEDDESLEELPTLVEKPKRKAAANLTQTPSKVAQLAQPTPSQSVKSMVSMLGKSRRDHSVSAHEDSLGNDEDADTPVDESLPSFSEAILKPRSRGDVINESEMSGVSPSSEAITSTAGKANQPELPTNRRTTRPQLHQQMIDRTIQRKRHETLTDAFHRWRRGLRVQQQSRRAKAKQLQLVEKKLQLLRRNQSFLRWRQWTERKHQVLECREEAFDQRRQLRQMRSIWMQWVVVTMQAKLRRRLLRRLVMSVETNHLRLGFHQWKTLVGRSRIAYREQALRKEFHATAEKRMHAIAVNHHEARVVAPFIRRIVRVWHRVATQSCQRKRILYRMLTWHSRRHQLRAWNTWKHSTTLKSQADQINQRRREELAETTATAGRQLKAREQELHDQHEKQLSELQAKIEEQQRALRTIENEKLATKKRLADAKASARAQWHSVVERLLKQAVAEADAQITTVSTRLEAFLQQMDVEPENARFQAASFLIESMLEQKMRHANERVHAQEELLRDMDTNWLESKPPVDAKPETTAWKSTLTNNARFLLEMAQQRYTRLHQLYQAVAKLAATVVDQQRPADSRSGRTGGGAARVDTAKFKHAAFLTDAMRDRTLQHLDAVLSIQYRRCAPEGLASSTREARKY